MRDTSLAAYETYVEPTLGERQKVVYEVLEKHADLTNREIKEILGWEINTVTPRVYELRDRGLVFESSKRICKVTGRLAYAWSTKRQNSLFIN